MMQTERDALSAAEAIKGQIQELGAEDHDVEFRVHDSNEWRRICVDDVRADGVMLRIESADSTILCAPLQFAATFRRVPKIAAVP